MSDSDEYTLVFRSIQNTKERIPIDMEGLEWEENNEPYKIEDLKYTLNSCGGLPLVPLQNVKGIITISKEGTTQRI
jgi:hypothetical protein